MKINLSDPRIEEYGLTVIEYIVYCIYDSVIDDSYHNICAILSNFNIKPDTIYRIIKRLKRKGIIYDLDNRNLYLIADKDKSVVKIGISNNAKSRLKYIQTSNPMRLELLFEIENMSKYEIIMHDKFAGLRLSGEWFTYDDSIINAFIELDKNKNFN